jgi:hypothetical protein
MRTDDELCGARPADPFTSPCDRRPGHTGGHHGLALGDRREDGSRGVIDRVWQDKPPKQSPQRGMGR